jgi:DNA-binding MarR family transcriptional regulator
MRATQFQTLMTIAEAGNVTVTQLTRLLLIDQTTLTRNLAVLKRDGLLRDVQSSDGRLRSVKLTRKGERAIEAAIPLWSKVQKQVTNAIGMTGWASISAELEKLAGVGARSDEK